MSSEVAVARWTADEIAYVLGAAVDGDGGAAVDAITTDSRSVREGAAFFALDGARVRGAEYVPDAFGSGCSVVVVPTDWAGDVPPGRAALRVPDPLAALGELAATVRRAWDAPVIAITGSVGKTTAKEMTAAVLEHGGPVLRTPGNYNTRVGLALTLLAAEPPRVAVLEVGASEPGEIANLGRLVAPTAAAVTNVAAAHLAGFGSVADVAREKTDLLRAVAPGGLRLVDGDDESLAAATSGLEVLRVGLGEGNDLRAVDPERLPEGGTRFRVEDVTVELPVPGFHQVRNALFALAFGRAHGVSLADGAARLRGFAGVGGRLGLREVNGVLVVDDSYNANPVSVAAALEWFGGHPVTGRRAVALGDMLELGDESPAYHREAGARAADLAPDLAVFVGSESRAAFEEYQRRRGDQPDARWMSDSDEAARALREWARPGDAVLVKGSRGVGMERVVRALAEEESGDAV